METKLIAAEIATAAGATTIITSSKRPENIFDIIEYHRQNTSKDRSGSGTPCDQESRQTAPSSSDTLTSTRMRRPPHTVFTASPVPVRDLKTWTSHTLHPSGSVIIDAGAHHVLSRRESGGRLLAAGVLGVVGAFV
jgi:glutamate 5-kinase